MAIVDIAYIGNLGFALPSTGANDLTDLDQIIERNEEKYLRGTLGNDLYNSVVANPTDSEVIKLLDGVKAENIDDDYQGIKQDVAYLCVSIYYKSLGQSVHTTGFSDSIIENSEKLSPDFSVFNTWQKLLGFNKFTRDYLVEKKGTGFFANWTEDLFHEVKQISLW